MNANRRKVLISGTVVRAKLRDMSLDDALDETLAKAEIEVTEIEWAGLRRDAEQVLGGGRWPCNLRQIEIAFLKAGELHVVDRRAVSEVSE